MADKSKVMGALDNPVLFVLAMTLAVCATKPIIKWGLTAAGMPGAAQVFN